MPIIDLTRTLDFGHGGSAGNLKKFKLGNYFYKTGRLSSRDFPNRYGIEPLIEVACCEIGRVFGFNTLEQTLHLAKLTGDMGEHISFVSQSPDYAYDREEVFYTDLKRNRLALTWDSDLLDMLLLDFLVMNEDRHDRNVVFVDGKLVPIFDLGYSLAYDNVTKFTQDHTYHKPFANCNAPLYQNSFHGMEQLLTQHADEISQRLNRFCSLALKQSLQAVQTHYNTLKGAAQHTVIVDNQWFEQVHTFINWRVAHVRNLLHEME